MILNSTQHDAILGDCLEIMRSMPDESVDLCVTSPPYVDARTYGIDFKLRGEDWVRWAFEIYKECVRVTRGLVAWVVEGRTYDGVYDCTPAKLEADLSRAGLCMRTPCAYVRHGIPGSGGKQWLKNRWEKIICCSHNNRLPWSDNTAMGHVPLWAPGGEMSHRTRSGARRNAWGKSPKQVSDPSGNRQADGTRDCRPRSAGGECIPANSIGPDYMPPKISNPGNWLEETVAIDCGSVGGGNMGNDLAHENEAPFPEKIPEFFIRSFCPLGGLVLDPFCGSGTTLAVAKKLGRNSLGIDLRQSQIDLSYRRLAEVVECQSTEPSVVCG